MNVKKKVTEYASTSEELCVSHLVIRMSFDVARCISLHNTIVARAIAQLPEDLQPTIIRN